MAIIITVRRFRATCSWEEEGIQTDRQIKWKAKGLAAKICAPCEPQGPGMGFREFSAQGPSFHQVGLWAWAGSLGCTGREEPGRLATPHTRPRARNTASCLSGETRKYM